MLHKILVPLDGSELAEKALPYAEALAQKFEAALILVWVLQDPLVVPPPVAYGGVMAPIDTVIVQQDEEAKTYLRRLQETLRGKNISTRIEILKSHSVADAIIDLARQEKIDVIVKTTHGRSGLSRWIYGNVATKVLQGAPCPVFLVRVSAKDLTD